MATGIVLIRNWFGSEDAFVTFGRRFGELERASPRDLMHEGQLFRVLGRSTDRVGRYWHADGFAKTAAPARLTLYHVARGASAASGTAFIDGWSAWRDLPPLLRHRLCDRAWMHESGSMHPFIAEHPVYRCPMLSVNLGRMSAITDMDVDEMRQTIAELAAELDQMPRYVHVWEPGQILLVDNRRMLHRGPDQVDLERILWRASVTTLLEEGFRTS